MPKNDKSDSTSDSTEALTELVTEIAAEIIAEDDDSLEQYKEALRDVVEAELGDVTDEIKSALKSQVEELDFDEIREQAVKHAICDVIEKLHDEAHSASA